MNVTSYGKRDFADVTRLSSLRQGDDPRLSEWVDHKGPKRYPGRVRVREKPCDGRSRDWSDVL